MSSLWDQLAPTWKATVMPPQCPVLEEVSFVCSHIPKSSKVVVLGVTPELTCLFDEVVAVDSSSEMIRLVWEGNSKQKIALQADWLKIELENNFYNAVVGDGSLSVLGNDTDVSRLIARSIGWLRPEGKIVLRMYMRPEQPIKLQDITEAINLKTISMRTIRRLVGWYLAERQNGIVTDKQRCELLSELMGKETKTDIDVSVWFPNRQEVKKLVGGELITVGSYPMADCFPYLVIRKY
jgi:hypothetical protein